MGESSLGHRIAVLAACAVLVAFVTFPRERAATSVQFPAGLALAPDGRVVVADRRASRIYALDLETGVLEPLAGTGEAGFSGDGGHALEARLQHPDWVAFAPDGDLLIADTRNHRVRRVDAESGRIETIAGTGVNEAAGDGGSATAASLTNPYGISVSDAGDIYVFDTEAHSIRRIAAATGTIETVVGTGEAGYGGDGGPGREAQLRRPHNGVVSADGKLVFGDSFNLRIRRWDPSTDRIETLAGAGEEGVSPPGTPALEARLMPFGAIVEEPDGSLVYTGLEGRIMRIRASDGRLELVAGMVADSEGADEAEEQGVGDGGPATAATMRIPYGLVRLPNGDFVFSDAGNGHIRRIDARTGVIHRVI